MSEIKRRTFITGILTSLGLSGCVSKINLSPQLPEASPAQKAERKVGRSQVGIIKASSYDEDLFALLKQYVVKLSLPSLKGKSVVIKPNMVEYEAGHPITTHPSMLKAAVELVNYLGATKITIAEGPGHMRDTEFLLDASGIGAMCASLDLPFVDLNCDDLEEVKINNSFSGLDHFYLPRTILSADAIVSLPKMKTHHWVGVTASMKNLFGIVPGRKYGYPKNLLHVKGIPNCILDINRLVHPVFALVDGITAMEGDGPIMGTAYDTKIMLLGTDVAAVDATCARIMGFNPYDLAYLKLAGEVIGNIDSKEIDIVGTTIASVAHNFSRPVTFLAQNNPGWRPLPTAGQQGS